MKGEYQNRKVGGAKKAPSTSRKKGTKVRFLKPPNAFKMAYFAGQEAVLFDAKKIAAMEKAGVIEKC